MKRSAMLVASAVVMLAASSASAEPSSRAIAAEELFNAGRSLLAHHQYKEACEKLDASEKLDPAVGTLFSLGECYEGDGRTASAWFAFRASVALAAQRGDLRRAIAERRAAALEPNLASIELLLGDAAAQTSPQILIDGEPFTGDALRAPIPVDPGPHAVEVSAPGHRPWSTRVVVHDHEKIKAEIPALELVPTADPQDRAESARSVRRTVGIAFVSGGVLALTAGAVFGLRAIAKARDARSACPNDGACSDADAVHADGVAKTFADASTVAIPIGAALVGVGSYLLLTSRSSSAPEMKLAVTSSGARVGLGWSW